jgi:pimeloyl-ACP methyl ester carboxylesterase
VQPTLLRQLPCLHEIRFRCADRIVRVGGLEWRLRDTGGGPSVLIMLPGSLGNADTFYLQLLHLAYRARCIAIDYPETPMAALADGLAALIDVLNIGRVNLLGCSPAGYWLWTFGSRHPGRIKSVTLANAFRSSSDLRHHPLFSLSFGPFSLLTAERLLKKADEPIPLGDSSLDILIALAKRAGEVVTHRELISTVWQGVTVEDANLRAHIAALRKAAWRRTRRRSPHLQYYRSGLLFCCASHTLDGRSNGSGNGEHPTERAQRLPPRPARMVGRDNTVRSWSGL